MVNYYSIETRDRTIEGLVVVFVARNKLERRRVLRRGRDGAMGLVWLASAMAITVVHTESTVSGPRNVF
jgi:hypothetical protein